MTTEKATHRPAIPVGFAGDPWTEPTHCEDCGKPWYSKVHRNSLGTLTPRVSLTGVGYEALAANNIIELAAAHITVTLDRDALRARNAALVEAVTEFLDHGDRIEKCSVSTCPSWNRLRAALAADAKGDING